MSSNRRVETLHQAENWLNELNMHQIFYRIVYHKRLIILLTVLSLSSGIFYTSSLPPKYNSSALIQVDNQLGSANNMQQMLGNIGASFASGLQVAPADIEIALIKSRFILQSVLESMQLDLNVSPYYFPLLGSAIARFQDGTLKKPLFNLSRFAWGGEKIVLKNFSVGENSPNQKFYVRVKGNNEYDLIFHDGRLLLSGKIGKTASTPKNRHPQVNMLIQKLKANPGTYFKVWLRHTDEVLKELSSGLTINDLGEKTKTKTGVLQLSYQGVNPLFISQVLNKIIDFAIQRNIEKKSAEASKTLEFLKRQLPNVHKSLETAETVLNVYRAKNGTIDISQEAKIMLMQLSAIEQSIAELKLKKVEMLQELTPQHPYVISLTSKQDQLQKEVNAFEKKIKSLPLTDQKALSLERDVKVKNQLYLLLLNKIQQLEVLKAGTLSDIRILSRATVPITPLPDHKTFIIISSLLFGFSLSLLIIFFRDILKPERASIEEIEECLDISTFAIIPYSAKQKQLAREMKKNKQTGRPFVLVDNAPNDIAIEGIRGLRTVLQHALTTANNNIVSVLGASPHIGKSFVSTNLAHVLSDGGKKVVLIDCDMRRGRIHTYFNLKKNPGFSNLLNKATSISEAVKKVGTHFNFIPAGDYPKNPSEMLLSPQFGIILKELSQDYDLVIIDTPPVLAVTDAILIAKLAEINLMVIGYGKDQMIELNLAVKRVRKNGINIHGLVFNSPQEIKDDYLEYNYYYAYETNT